MTWVESMCKSVKPDVVVIDMGDKFARTAGYARPDEALKANAAKGQAKARVFRDPEKYETISDALLNTVYDIRSPEESTQDILKSLRENSQ